MNIKKLKEDFSQRTPKYLSESFLIEEKSLITILQNIRKEVSEKDIKKDSEENQLNTIKRQKELLYNVLITEKKPALSRKEVIKNIVNIVKDWHTLYHPTDSDYKNLAGQIIDYLHKENLISKLEK